MEKEEKTEQVYEFGPYRIDVRRRVLLRAGEPVAGMTPKLVETLLALVARSGEIVGKDELMAAVWPDAFVEESNLSSNISHLRKALGTDADGRAYIETFPKRGYRFTAEVRACAEQSSTRVVAAPPVEVAAGADDAVIIARRTRAHIVTHTEADAADAAPPPLALPPAVRRRRAPFVLLASAVALLTLGGLALWLWHGQRARGPASAAEVKTLAILPFRVLDAPAAGAQAADAYLGLGMADALITKLGNLHHVVARPTSAVRRYAAAQDDPVKAGRELGVDAVLVGNIQRAGERLRVTVQLLRVTDGTPLWGETFDTPFTDIFAVQDSISVQVLDALTVRLSGEEQARLHKRYTENAVAYEAYLKGRYFWNKRDAQSFKTAIGYFKQATDNDPNYALAYAGLADCYNLFPGFASQSPKDYFPLAEAAAAKALSLDETLAEAHTSLAWVKLNYYWDWAGAEREFQRALKLNPNYTTAHQWYGLFLVVRERFDEALRELQTAQQLDPLSLAIGSDLGKALFYARRYEESERQLRKLVELDQKYTPAHYHLRRVYLQQGRFREAIAEGQAVVALQPENPAMVSALAQAYALAGQRAEALKLLAQLQTMAQTHYVQPSQIVMLYADLGQKEEAFAWFEQAFQDRDINLPTLKIEPQFDPLRADPRYAAVLQRTGL